MAPFSLIILLASSVDGNVAAQERVPSPPPAVEARAAPASAFDELEPDTLGVEWPAFAPPRYAASGGCCVYAEPTYFEDRAAHLAPFDEFVELEADSLEPYPEFAFGPGWNALPRRATFTLADGSKLVVGRDSPAGSYVLDDWRLLDVGRGPRGAASWRTRPRLSRALQFRTISRRRVGLIVEAPGDTALGSEREILEEYFVRHRSPLGGVSPQEIVSGQFAAEVAAWGRAHAALPMPDRQEGCARVLWVTFAADPEARPPALVNAERRWVEADGGTGRWQLSETPPSRMVLAYGRVLGSVLVDLRSGRVVQRRGLVR